MSNKDNMFDNNKSSSYNVNTNHPLINNSQEYMYYKKFVSIHSEDRDIATYPNSSEFEIEMPEDMLNVSKIGLIQWTFPANYNTFSVSNKNVTFIFQINSPYNPGANNYSNLYDDNVFEALYYNINNYFLFTIEEGFYNPQQMCNELTNKLNTTVTNYLKTYFKNNNLTESLNTLNENGGYKRFSVVYNNVSIKLWFGNNADGFKINNEIELASNINDEVPCLIGNKSQVPNFSNWGLSSFLGLPRCAVSSVNTSITNVGDYDTIDDVEVPRFYYGDVYPGDDGFWLLPDTNLPNCKVNWVESLYKINLMGDAYIYMELDKQNCIDETQPWNLSTFNLTTNKTNGIVNSSFAKIPVPSTPLSQWFDRDSIPYKYYYPPAQRIRKLKIKLRYHDGRLVDFGVFNYSFMLEFTLMVPQILRETNTIAYPVKF
jgi:hypothetical protein